MAKLAKYLSTYPQHKREHSRRLAAPQIMPLTGDGANAERHSRRGQYFNNDGIAAQRAKLVAARYRDWLIERDRMAALAQKFAAAAD